MYVRSSVVVEVLPNDGDSFPPPSQSVDDKLPTIPSSSSLTGGGSEGGLGCIDELASESTDSMSDGDGTLSGAGDTGRTGVLPQLVANPPVLLLPSKTGSPKTQKRVCHLDRYRLEFDTIRFCEPQALDVRKTSLVPVLCIMYL